MIPDEKQLKEVIACILRAASPDRIILFGSAATGEFGKDSDIDLLILERNPTDQRRESIRIRRALKQIGIPIDIIVMKTKRFEETKEIIGGLACPANRYGRVLYEAA